MRSKLPARSIIYVWLFFALQYGTTINLYFCLLFASLQYKYTGKLSGVLQKKKILKKILMQTTIKSLTDFLETQLLKTLFKTVKSTQNNTNSIQIKNILTSVGNNLIRPYWNF